MKYKKIKILLASLSIVFLGTASVGASCVTECSHEVDGATCDVTLTQHSTYHELEVECTDDYYFEDEFDGHYTGPLCGEEDMIEPCLAG